MIAALQLNAQHLKSYRVTAHFFPRDTQMWGYPVNQDAFMRGTAEVEWSETPADTVVFYMHGELKIDSVRNGNRTVGYQSEKILYRYDYSRVAVKTTIMPQALQASNTLTIYYSGFMHASKARSLSDYMRINRHDGVYLRAYGYSLWFPVFKGQTDDRYQVDFQKIRVTLPNHFRCVVGGQLLQETYHKDRYEAVWRPGYARVSDIQCTARRYNVVKDNHIAVYYTTNEKIARDIMGFAAKLKQFYKTHLRSVQDSSTLYIMELPRYGNISSLNMIGMSQGVYQHFHEDINCKLTIAHELVHPYVILPVKKENPFYALIVEGFPAFFHLYGLAKILPDTTFDLGKYMQRLEQQYLRKKSTGKNRRGFALPEEKPIVDIKADEIGLYKDRFILSDRVRLFFFDLWQNMGDASFDRFIKELFMLSSIDYTGLEKRVLKYLPEYKDHLHTWLNTTDYPEALEIKPR
ncbi:MAG: hypothetical protein GF313_16605 [Caldithrix sp.]|nr:hypothetical protein [Caldithrix sp.]